MPSEKILAEKVRLTEELAEKIKKATAGVLVQYTGITVEQDTAMRAEMRKAGVEYKVYKNTMTGRACELAGYPEKCEGYPLIHGTKYLPFSQSFTSRSSTWSFARKGTLRYVMKSGDFVMSASDNPSGLKLSYKYTNGYFKGAFTVYALRNEKYIKRYSAKVSGFMVGNSGEGVVTINKVGTFSCTISH